MATKYGTIPTSSSQSAAEPPVNYISRAKEIGRSALATRRSWREMVHRHAFNLPPSLGEAYLRLRKNTVYFAMNYAIIVLLVLFVSLIWHPLSLIVFIVMMALWLFLYFLRDEPLLLLGRVISDKYVLIVLSVLTLGMLLLTDAKLNILVSLLVGLLIVVTHAVVRRTDDLSDEEEAVGSAGGWYSTVATSSS